MTNVSPKTRPAEWSAAAAGLALLIVSIAGVDDPAILTALGVVIAFIPTAVTGIVTYVREQQATVPEPPPPPPPAARATPAKPPAKKKR